MIDAVIEVFVDILDFFADAWVNKVSAKYHRKKEAEKRPRSPGMKSEE